MTNKDKQLSLNIKTDENNKALPLGIKSTVEGIEHFTNWDNVANSIDETGKLRRDRSSLKRVIFENERTPDVITRTNTYSQHSQFKYSVDDSWDVNKIKILDRCLAACVMLIPGVDVPELDSLESIQSP